MLNKCFLAILCFLLVSFQVKAENAYQETIYNYDKLWDQNGQLQQKVADVGFKVLNENKFSRSLTFYVKPTKRQPNAFASYCDGKIVVYSSILKYLDSDDELAALLAHEVAHMQQLSTGFWPWKRIKMRFAPQYYEHDADIKAIDYMIKAGYNPLAMITFLNKLTGEFSWYLRFFHGPLSHPTSSKRLVKVYNHIQVNYPQYLSKDYDNPYYQNFLMNSEHNKDIKQIKEKHDL